MAVSRAPWAYTGHVSPARLDCLEHDESFADIIEDLRRYARVERLMQSRRATFVVSAPDRPSLLDRFFNSRAGYRGQYYVSVEQGEDGNRATVEALLDKLTHAIDRGQHETSAAPWEAMLLQTARVWVNGDCVLELERPREIEAERWMTRTRDRSSDLEQDSNSTTAEMGLRAPIPEYLVVGTGVGPADQLQLKNRKRAVRLHELGWI